MLCVTLTQYSNATKSIIYMYNAMLFVCVHACKKKLVGKTVHYVLVNSHKMADSLKTAVFTTCCRNNQICNLLDTRKQLRISNSYDVVLDHFEMVSPREWLSQ